MLKALEELSQGFLLIAFPRTRVHSHFLSNTGHVQIEAKQSASSQEATHRGFSCYLFQFIAQDIRKIDDHSTLYCVNWIFG